VTVLYNRRVTLNLMVQPIVAVEMLSDPLLVGQGLLSRVLTVAPKSMMGSRIPKYVENRYAEGAKPATVKLEIACLRRMFRLGMEATPRKVTFVPKFPNIAPNNVRKGFFEHDAFERVLAELREPALRTLAIVGYWLGWRKGELLGLERRQVDLDAGTVRLDPGTTKNKEGRVVYLPPEALAALKALDEHTRALERERNVIVRNVFHRDGETIRDFYGAWRSVCKRAGVPGMLFHDLRRTAARNYIRSGNHESVVMKILGHKTMSIFDRYNVTSEDDLRQAASTVVSLPRNGSQWEQSSILTPRDVRSIGAKCLNWCRGRESNPHRELPPEGILSPLRLPFRHPGALGNQ
jgi:integrase